MSFTLKLEGRQLDDLKRVCRAAEGDSTYLPLRSVRVDALGKANGKVNLQFSATDGKFVLAERIQVQGDGLVKGQSFYIPTTQLKKSLGWKANEAVIEFLPGGKVWKVTLGPIVKAGGHGEFTQISHSFTNQIAKGPDYQKFLDEYVFAAIPHGSLGSVGFCPKYLRKIADVYRSKTVQFIAPKKEGDPVAFRPVGEEDPVRGLIMPVRIASDG